VIPHLSERVLILAPHGRDAQFADAMLREAGFLTGICGTMNDLQAAVARGAGCALLTEESLHSADLHPLAAWLDAQQEWSDFPFILLTRKGGGIE